MYLEVKWIPPELSDENLDGEREASVVLAEELIRSASQAKAGVDLMGTSIGAFNTVTGLSGHVHMIQNTLGSALDTVESIRNAFNFSVRCIVCKLLQPAHILIITIYSLSRRIHTSLPYYFVLLCCSGYSWR